MHPCACLLYVGSQSAVARACESRLVVLGGNVSLEGCERGLEKALAARCAKLADGSITPGLASIAPVLVQTTGQHRNAPGAHILEDAAVVRALQML